MTRSRSPSGRTHLEAIADALRRVVAELELEPDGGAPGDRVAVIGFHGQVVPVLGLSRNRRAADDALARVPDLDLETVTDFVPPIIRGRAMLTGAEDVGNAPVLVLVSDGAPYDPEAGITAPLPGEPVLDPILENARDARRAGITIVALLVGGRYDTGAVGPWLFERIATSRDTYRHSQDGEDLAALFGSICLRSAWPGRTAGHSSGSSR